MVTSETARGLVLTDPFQGAGAMDLAAGSTTPAERLVTAELTPGTRPEMAIRKVGLKGSSLHPPAARVRPPRSRPLLELQGLRILGDQSG